MYKKLIYFPIIISSFLISCTKDAELISKEHPVIETHNVSNINPDGVTFKGEFIDIGYSKITEYGFNFSTDESMLENSTTLIMTSEASNGVFSKSIQEGIAGNVIYNVKAYAKTENYILYGNSVEFFSQGSKFSPWDLILQTDMNSGTAVHSSSTNEFGFILFQSNAFYSYNPILNRVIKKQNIPLDGWYTSTYFASFNLGNYLYVIATTSNLILRYNIENNYWEKLGNRPFQPNKSVGFFGFSIDNTGYFLSRDNFYAYNPSSDTWQQKPDLPCNHLYSAEVIGNRVYVFTDNQEIWSYSPEDDNWQKETQYPGEWMGSIVSFSQNNRIYWGLSYVSTFPRPPSARYFWEYNPELNNWKEIENFPLLHSQEGIFTFSIGSFSYFGYRVSRDLTNGYGDYFIFSFDSQKIK